jgi:hypothetical protein
MNRIEYNSDNDDADSADSELDQLFKQKLEMRKKRAPNKPKLDLVDDTEIILVEKPISVKKERSEAQKQATIAMREKLKSRHEMVQKVKIESQEIVKMQHKELQNNIKKKLFKQTMSEQVEMKVQERLNEMKLKAESEAKEVKPKRIRAPRVKQIVEKVIRAPSPEPLPPPPPQKVIPKYHKVSFF